LVWAVTDVGRCDVSDFDSAEVVAGFVRDVGDVVSSSPSEGGVVSASLVSVPLVSVPLVSVPLVSVPDVEGGDSFVVAEPVDASEEPVSDDESDPPASATAMPGLFATAAPIPRATASAPTRPTNLAGDGACRRRPITGNGVHESSRGVDIEAHLLGRTKTRTWL
jgi:hypothetical protein